MLTLVLNHTTQNKNDALLLKAKKSILTFVYLYDRDVAVPEHPGAQVLFQTEFTNRTEQPQEYTFKAERTTRSACDISIEKGVTKVR